MSGFWSNLSLAFNFFAHEIREKHEKMGIFVSLLNLITLSNTTVEKYLDPIKDIRHTGGALHLSPPRVTLCRTLSEEGLRMGLVFNTVNKVFLALAVAGVCRLAVIGFWLVVTTGCAYGALGTLAEVRELPRVPESVGLPLTVRGVVLQQNSVEAAAKQELVVHDGTAAIYVTGMPASPAVRAGDRVEVELLTELGRYAMMARGLRLVRLGEGVLPEPLAVSLGELNTGVFDGQWIRLRGVVASAISGYPARMALNTEQGVVRLNVLSQMPPAACERLIDAEVVVDGVCLPLYNMREELLGVHLSAYGPGAIRVLRAPEDDPFAVPEADAARLSPFSTKGPILNRRRISGVVTAIQDERIFYIYAGGRGIRVASVTGESPSVGDRLEISGFVDRSGTVAGLQYALFRKTGVLPLPRPVKLTRTQAFHLELEYDVHEPDYYARLVTVTGELRGVDPREPERKELLLDWDGYPLRVHLGKNPLPQIRAGSLLQVTGVCLMDYWSGQENGGQLSVREVSLLPCTPADVAVIRAAPWWTPQRLLAAIGLLLLVVAGVTLWSLLLSRQVERGVRRYKSEEAACLEAELRRDERTRIAADLHDTLEQNLTSMMLQVSFAEKAWKSAPEKLSEFFRVTAQVVAEAKANLRSSVWNLRSEVLKEKTLTQALAELPKVFPGLEFVLDLYAVSDDIPAERAAQVFSVVQEAVTNAVKHAKATEIALIGEPFQGRLKLLVQDNGQGFDVERADSPETGHFGLAGMRERMGRINGVMVIESEVGKGTTVMVIYDGLRKGADDDSGHAG